MKSKTIFEVHYDKKDETFMVFSKSPWGGEKLIEVCSDEQLAIELAAVLSKIESVNVVARKNKKTEEAL